MTPYRDDRTVSSLLSDVFRQLSVLVRSEINLAQAELTAKATGAAVGLGLVFGAVLFHGPASTRRQCRQGTVFMTSRYSGSPTTTYTEDLLEAARENPLPTALIGIGIAWMITGGNTTSVFRKMRNLGGTAASTIGAGGQKVGDGASALAASIKGSVSAGSTSTAEGASEITSAAKQHMNDGSASVASAGSGIAASISDGFDSATQAVGHIASGTQAHVSGMSRQARDGTVDFVATLRDGFADMLDRQPLVLGALGLAVGAGVAAVLPRIAAEDQLTGTIDNVKGSIREGFVGAYSRAKDEARAQGLTLEAATDAVSNIGAKVSGIAKDTAADAAASAKS